MNFNDYFDKFLDNDETIKAKRKLLEEREKICTDIISNNNYIDWLIGYLLCNKISKEDVVNLGYLEYFYDVLKEYLNNNYYYDFYDEDYFIIKYKEFYLKFDKNKKCKLIGTAEKYILFNDIIEKKESKNKDFYLSNIKKLNKIKNQLPKKLIKKIIDN